MIDSNNQVDNEDSENDGMYNMIWYKCQRYIILC